MEYTEKIYKTTCCYCGVGCGMLITKDKHGTIAAEGDPENPANKGMLCSKGMNLHYTAMDKSDRLLYPMIRDDLYQSFQQITWDQAIQTAAARFKKIIALHGPDAVGFYISGQCLTEEYYIANKIMKGFIGSNNIDTNSRLCMSAAVSAYKLALGEDCVPGCYEDIELANTFLIAGANPAWCHPILFKRIEAHKAKNSGVKIIVVDPRRTQTADAADLHLQIIPGTDIVLFHAIARGLIENGFIDEPFIRLHTKGFEALRQKVMQRTLKEAAEICGIRFTDIYKAVKYIGSSSGFISLWAMGLNQSVIGVHKNLALINLSLITGKIGKPGSGPFSLTGQTNAMGGREAGGMATLLPAHREIKNPAHRKEIADYWKAPSIADKPGLTATEMFTALRKGTMKAIWIICTNPLVSIPDSNLVEKALKKAEFVIVQDMSSKADTLQFAHLILPAATWLEKEGTVTNSERRISHLSKVTDPPGEALADTEILLRFAKAMGWEDHFTYNGMDDIYKEHAGLTKNTHLDISHLNYEILRAKGTVRWPFEEDTVDGTHRLFTDHQFYHPDGKARITAVADENLSESLSEEFPLILTTGRIRDQWHTMTRSGKVNKLKQHISHPFVEIHPADAEQRKIYHGDPVVIAGSRGSVQVCAQLTDSIKKGVVFIPMHWGMLAGKSFGRANNLTTSLVDPVSMQPDFKYSPVQVSRYYRPPQKIIIAGGSPCIISFIKTHRALNDVDTIDWICSNPENAFYDESLGINGLRNNTFHIKNKADDFIKEFNIHLIKDRFVTTIERDKKLVIDNKQHVHSYDKLILADAVHSCHESVFNSNQIFYWKNKQHIHSAIQQALADDIWVLTGNSPALYEVAAVLAQKKIKVYVLTPAKKLLENMLDETASDLLENILKDTGIEIMHEAKIQTIEHADTVQKIILKDGQYLICHVILSFEDEYPGLSVATNAGLKINKGILVNEFLQTNDPDIFAMGERTEYENQLTDMAARNKQAECLANYFHGNWCEYYQGAVPNYEWNIPVPAEKNKTDWKISVMGEISFSPDEECEEIVFLDKKRCIYKKCILHHDRLVGAILIGDQEGKEEYYSLIAQGTELGDKRDQLLRTASSQQPVKGRIICSCKQVGEGNLLDAIQNGHTTAEALGFHTGAGTQCGSCKSEMKALLKKQKL